VDRTTRFTMLLHLPPMPGHGGPRVKNGPALTGHGAIAVRDAITAAITTLPAQLRRSLTWDQGAELAQHAQLRVAAGLPVYFCDPQSPWQRGTNENTNGLLRLYFPRGTNLARHTADDLAAVAATLNGRPRKTLGWRTPAEASTNTSQPAPPACPEAPLTPSDPGEIRPLRGRLRCSVLDLHTDTDRQSFGTTEHQRCCEDRLSLGNTRHCCSPSAAAWSGSRSPTAPAGTALITPRSRASTRP